MRLDLPKTDRTQQERHVDELKRLAGCDRVSGPVCRPDCPVARTQACAPCCPEAPLALTNDRKFPIEDGILPLVFELKASRAFEPVWSCEGHLDSSGALFRPPSIWYCCESLPQACALAQVVTDLHVERRSSARWRVSLCCPGHHTPNAVFKLEPEAPDAVGLDALRKDVSVIAGELRPRLSMLGAKARA